MDTGKLTQFNLVEAMFGDEEECAFDQPCVYGHRVGHHSVYCHHPDGLARKCLYRFSKDLADYEQNKCGGYTPNPNWKMSE
jgi:hypothetical protein